MTGLKTAKEIEIVRLLDLAKSVKQRAAACRNAEAVAAKCGCERVLTFFAERA